MLWEIHKTAGSELLVEAAGVTRGLGEVLTLEEEFFIYSFIFFSLYLTTLVPIRSKIFICFYKGNPAMTGSNTEFYTLGWQLNQPTIPKRQF